VNQARREINEAAGGSTIEFDEMGALMTESDLD
jgi:hypothetical protein